MVLKEKGRSMVEILGVLAIIGVLSIGGITGYRHALLRWRMAEIADVANKLSVVVQTRDDYDEDGNVYADFSDIGLQGKTVAGVVTYMQAYTDPSAGHVFVEIGAPTDEIPIKVSDFSAFLGETDDFCSPILDAYNDAQGNFKGYIYLVKGDCSQ